MHTAAFASLAATLLLGSLPAQFVFESKQLQHFPADGLQALKSSFADFDGDGDLDVVTTGTPGTTTLQRFYRNDGRGVFSPHAAWPDVVNAANHLVADFDGDGDADVLLDGAIVRNLGGGVLQLTAVPVAGWPVACADFDGDGLHDVFVRFNNGLGVALFRQVGGTFVPAPVPNANVLISDGAAADFDGDGDVDVLLAARPYVIPFGPIWPGNDRLWRNIGLGQFVEQYLPGAQNVDTPNMVVADFDGDGDHDCALRTGGFPSVWQLRLNDGLGNMLVVTGHLPANLPQTPLSGVDLDGDGDLDLAGAVSWLENDGTAHFTVRAYLQAVPSLPFDHGDVDGDGDLDLVAAAGLPARLLLSLAPGRFADGSSTPWSRATAGCGDLDGDGDVDLLAAPGTQDGVLGINDGTGWFTEAPFPWPAGQALPSSVQFVDADGDTDRDVLCLFSPSSGSMQVRLFRNNGSGAFVDAGQTGMPTSLSNSTTALATLDADGDGDRDLLLVVRQGGVFLHANNGAGAFSAVPGAFPAYAGWLQTVAVGDLDGDGDTDVLTGDESYGAGPPSTIHYFANNGAGVFTDVSAQRLQAPDALTRHLTLADVDADGDLDAFAACWGTASYPNSMNLLLLNNAGALIHQPSALPNVLPTGTAALGDLDDDGDLDAVVGTYHNGVRFWRNQGAATFADAGGIFPLPSTVGYQPFLTADLDDDLDVDLLTGAGALSNQHWAADRTLLCRIGGPLPYAVRTLTNATVALPFFALQFARVPLPPFGTLAMPVGSPLLLPPLPLSSGIVQVTWPIPAVPGLIGLELVLQSLFTGGTALHLSPAVRLPVLD